MKLSKTLLLIAVLISSIECYTYTLKGEYGDPIIVRYSVSLDADSFIDMGYKSSFDKKHQVQTEQYGLNFGSFANATLKANLFGQWDFAVQLSMIPFFFTPYSQAILWKRPESGNFYIALQGSYDVQILKFLVTAEENWKSCIGSVGDYIRNDFQWRKLVPSDEKGDCKFESNLKNRWVDNFIKLDTIPKVFPQIAKSHWYRNPFYFRVVMYGEDPVNPSFMSGVIDPDAY